MIAWVGAVAAASAVAALVEALRRSLAVEVSPPAVDRFRRADRTGAARLARRRRREVVARWWVATLDDSGVEGDPLRWARVLVLAAVAVAVLGAWRAGPAGAATLLGAATAAALASRRALRGRGSRRADDALPDLLDHVGRGLRSGLDVVGALRTAAGRLGGRHAEEVLAVTARVGRGADLGRALEPWVAAHPRPAVRLAVGSLEVAVEAGGSPARALDGVAATLRDRMAVASEARALASQAQASAAVMVALPLVFALGSAASDGDVAGALLGTGGGRALLAAAVGLDVVGGLWMLRIVGPE